MAKFKIADIEESLPEGWSVLSENYVNMDTEMEFECPEHHRVLSTWRRMRKNTECPVCNRNAFKVNEAVIVPKQKGKSRVLALDQASHNTGWAIYDGKDLIKYGMYSAPETDELSRYLEIRNWLISMINNWKPDIIGIEGIQYEQYMGVTTFQTLARLQGIIMVTCAEGGVECKVCHTNTWRSHCGVKGRSRADKKKSMQLLIKQWFDISVNDDMADAIGIGKYVADNHYKKTEIVNWE